MRRAVLLAAITLPLLTAGCGAKARASENAKAVSAPSREEVDAGSLRSSIPAIEAYNQDNNTYAGVTLAKLRSYDTQVANISIAKADKKSYCIESVGADPHLFFAGSNGTIMLGSCADPASGKPYDPPPTEASSSSSEPQDGLSSLRASIPAIEAYFNDHNTYIGTTVSKLREDIDQGLPDITIVSAKKKTYCIEIAADGVTFFDKGPMGSFERGHCPG
jgi:hypothetical protein